MTQELSRPQKCVQIRTGVEIWVDYEKSEKLQSILEGITSHKFIRFEGQTFNTADLVGVFTPDRLEDVRRRRNGQWRCEKGAYHDKDIKECDCPEYTPEQIKEYEEINNRMKTVIKSV